MTPKDKKRFDKYWRIDEASEGWNGTKCRIWTGGKSGGYGMFSFGRKKIQAHRASYEHENGSIPLGTEIDHMCHNRACIEPSHLQAVTRQQNQLYKVTRDDTHHLARRTHCNKGHEYTQENTYVLICRKNNRPYRTCKACTNYRSSLRIERIRAGEIDPFTPKLPRATHCKHGHEFTPENTYVYYTGQRSCKACEQEKYKKRYASHREEMNRKRREAYRRKKQEQDDRLKE